MEKSTKDSLFASHVDDFIDDPWSDADASWFLMLHRLPATLQGKFAKKIDSYKLYCIYENELHRVTGASRLGDVWLTTDMEQTVGYEKRVDIGHCSEWRTEI